MLLLYDATGIVNPLGVTQNIENNKGKKRQVFKSLPKTHLSHEDFGTTPLFKDGAVEKTEISIAITMEIS